jgi:large subunit ribosomal protein L21
LADTVLKEIKMYAVIQTGGKQYRVEQGNTLLIEKLDVKEGEDVVLDNVLLIGDGEKISVGRPKLDGASVLAEVLKQTRGAKIIVFKKRSKKGYKKTQGHRQDLTEIKIKEIRN